MEEKDEKERAVTKLEALEQPLRLAILTSLSLRPASASDLAGELDAPPGKVRYQLDRLRKAGLTEVKERRQRRGVSEQVYSARVEPFSEAEISRLSSSQRERAIAGTLKAVVNDALKALRAGAFAGREGFRMTRLPMSLDEQGWADVVEVHRVAEESLLEVREGARSRLQDGGRPTADAFCALLLFDAAAPARQPLDKT